MASRQLPKSSSADVLAEQPSTDLAAIALSDAMAAIIDYRGKTPAKTAAGIPLITAKIIKGGRIERPSEFISESEYSAWMRRGMPQVGDVLITTEAPIGEVAQLQSERVALAQRVILLRGDARVLDNSFLKYLMLSDDVQRQLRSRASGTTVTGIKQSELRRITLRIPSLSMQRQIAEILGNVDRRIDLLREANETLEAMARAIFKSWFVDFDPVRAKAEGREPEGMDAATAALFPSEFQDSVLGPIPLGWSVATLEDYSSLNPESWSKSTRPSRVRYVDLANTKWGRIDAIADFEQADAPSRAQRILRQGDSIIGTVRPGNGSYALIGDEGLTGSTGFAVLRPKERHLAPFVYLAATERGNIDRLSSLADGGAYPAVRPEAVIKTPIVSPATSVLSSFGDITVPLLVRIDTAEKQVRTLSDLRDTLLPRLISGKLRVPEIEAVLAETL